MRFGRTAAYNSSMVTRIAFVVICVGGVASVLACSRTSSTESARAEAAPPEAKIPSPASGEALLSEAVLNFRVTGMHCDGCAQGIKAKLAKIDGVIEADASFGDSSATVKTSNPAIASKIVETIEEMQYHGELIEG